MRVHIWQGDYSELLEQRFRSLKKQCVPFFFIADTDCIFLRHGDCSAVLANRDALEIEELQESKIFVLGARGDWIH